MMDILSGNGKDEVIDCAKVANQGVSPITYADVTKDKSGNVIPRETVLTDAEDHSTTQSLDYIFDIKREHLHGKQKQQSSSKSSETTSSLVKGARLEVRMSDTKVEPFFIEGKVFTQLSDHYGVSAVIDVL